MFKGFEDLVLFCRNYFTPVDDALAALHHARGGRYRGEHVLAGRCGLHTVNEQVRLEVFVEVAARHHLARKLHRVGVHDLLVGRARGVEFAEWTADGFRALHEADAWGKFLSHFRQLFRPHDTGAVDLGKLLLDVVQVTGRHLLERAVHEVGAEGVDMPLSRRFVLREEGHELAQRTVALFLHFCAGLVDGKVKGGDERVVTPRAALFVFVPELCFARQEVDEQRHYDDERAGQRYAAFEF